MTIEGDALEAFRELPGSMTLAQLREFVDRLSAKARKDIIGGGTGSPIRMSQGAITAIDWTARTCTFKEFGDPLAKTKIGWNSYGYVPKVGEVCWLMKWGSDSVIVASPSQTMFSTPLNGRMPGCLIYRTTGQSITNDTVVPINWEAQAFDTDTMWEGVTNPNRITFITPGLYMFGCNIQWPSTATGGVRRILDARDNAAVIIDRAEQRYFSDVIQHEHTQRISKLDWFNVNDWIEFTCFHSATGALTLSVANPRYPHAWAIRVGNEP